MGALRNSAENQQLGHTLRSEPEVANGRSSAKDGALELLSCGIIQKEVSSLLQMMSAGATRTILPFYQAA